MCRVKAATAFGPGLDLIRQRVAPQLDQLQDVAHLLLSHPDHRVVADRGARAEHQEVIREVLHQNGAASAVATAPPTVLDGVAVAADHLHRTHVVEVMKAGGEDEHVEPVQAAVLRPHATRFDALDPVRDEVGVGFLDRRGRRWC